jgi:macrolide-specific efflux system membrane fusion protein
MKRTFLSTVAVAATLATVGSWAMAQSTGSRPMISIEHSLVTLIDDVPIPAREAGSLMELTVQEGALVKEGDILGEIDNLDALAKRDLAQGELEVAQTQANSDAELEAAKKGYQVALSEQQQFEDIRRKNAGAVSEFELRRAKFTTDKSFAQIQVAETDRTVAQLTTKLKQAQIQAAENELARRRVESPLSGQVVQVFKHKGEWCTPGEPILRVVRVDRVRVEGFVLTSAASPASVRGKPVKVTVFTAGGGTHEVQGTIDYASDLVEGAGSTRQFRVFTEVDNTQTNGDWVIQPGSAAAMLIDLSAPAVRRNVVTSHSKPPESTPTPAVALPAAAVPAARSNSPFVSPVPAGGLPSLTSPGGNQSLPGGSRVETRKPGVEAIPAATPAAAPAISPAATPTRRAPILPTRPRPANAPF